MKWLGFAIGLLIGWNLHHGDAVIYFPLAGFIIGMVIDLIRGASAKSAVDQRFEALERTVNQLATRLAALERRAPSVEPAEAAAQPPVVAPAQAGAQAAREALDPGLRRDDGERKVSRILSFPNRP